jgi:catechol 2,3-dioxygenase-like lactoylglutathione lyase family enzyme
VTASSSSDGPLAGARCATRLPAQDLDRARAWYRDKLGLEPVEERPGGLLYRTEAGDFALFTSAGAPSGDHTQMGFEVDDVDGAVGEMRRRGVVFESAGNVDVPGNYASKGSGERANWFRDSEGNILGIGQPLP